MAKVSIKQPGLVDSEDDERSLDLHGIGNALLRRSWIVALAAILTGLVAWGVTRRMPTLYQSTAVIGIDAQEQKTIDLRGAGQNDLEYPDVVETIIEVFHSRGLMERVNKALGLTTDARFLGYTPRRPASDDVVIASLLDGSDAVLRHGTRLIDVAFTHPDPGVARKVADAIVDQFLRQDVDLRAGMQEAQNRVLVQKAQELKDKVTRSELDLQDYKKKMASVSLEDRRNLFEQKLKDLNTDLTGAKAERLHLEADANQAKLAGGSTEQLLAIPSIAQDAQVLAAQERLTKAEEDMGLLAQRYGPLHPRMIEETAQLEAARQAVGNAARTAPDRIVSRYQAAQAREQGLQQALKEQEAALLDMDAKVIPFRALQREYDSNRTLFESVLQRLKESTLQLGVQSDDFQVVEPATTARAVLSRRGLYVAFGVLAGGFIAAAIVALLALFKQPISSVESAERLLKLPVLTAVPKIAAGADPHGPLNAMDRSRSLEAECFRSLRTGLQLLTDDSRKVILVTSAVPGEGKSVTAGNIAVTFAQLGLRTLLIEADLRRPSLDEVFFPPGQERIGLGEYLRGGPPCIVATARENLAYLGAGDLLPDPAEALSSTRFDEMIEAVKANYERIIIDTAPVNVVSDTLNIVASASVVCLVVRCNSTPEKQVRRAIELLRRSGVRPDGLILNWATVWTGRKYKEYYHAGGSLAEQRS